MTIEEKKCVSVEKTYHFRISIDGDEYFFICQTMMHQDKEVVISIMRGKTYWDCGKRLTTSQKKQIRRSINLMF